MATDDSPVYGCRQCGAFSDTVGADGACPECGNASTVQLNGLGGSDEAAALVAWARRDATKVIEDRGVYIGAGVGVLVGVAAALLSDGGGLASFFALLYAAVLGGLVGRLIAQPVYRLLRPNSGLQPIDDPRGQRRVRLALSAWLTLPIAAGILVLLASGDGDVGLALKRALGTVWSALVG